MSLMSFPEAPKTPDIEYEDEILKSQGFDVERLYSEQDVFDEDPLDALTSQEQIDRAITTRETPHYTDNLAHRELTLSIEQNMKVRRESLEKAQPAIDAIRASMEAAKAEKGRLLSTPEAAQARQAQFEAYIAKAQQAKVAAQQKKEDERPTIVVKKIVTENNTPAPTESRRPKTSRKFLDKVAVGVASLGIATSGVSAGMAIKTRDVADQAWENSQLVSGHIPGSVYDPYTDSYYDEVTGELMGRDYNYEQYQEQADTATKKYATAEKYEKAAIGGIVLFAVGMSGYTALGFCRKD